MESYDVIIAGAGISGLLLGKDLSKSFSVLILEKSSENQQVSKYWVTPFSCLSINPELSDCVDNTYKHMNFISHDEKVFQVFGDYALWNPDKLCTFLKKEIISNGGEIRYSHRFYNFSLKSNSIIIYANEKKIEAKLLVDCMGHASPLIYLNKSFKFYGYFMLYGGILPLRKGVDPAIMANVSVAKRPQYLEIFPTANNWANVAIIKPVSQIDSLSKLKEDFAFITQKSHYSDYFLESANYQELQGIVSIGSCNRSAMDRILFFGEAGHIQPAATNTCLTKLLMHHKTYSAFIAEQVSTQKLKKCDLLKHPVTINHFSRKLQINFYKEIQKWDSFSFSKFIDLLYCLDDKTLNDFMFDEITPNYFFEASRLWRVIKSGNYIWLKPFLKSLF